MVLRRPPFHQRSIPVHPLQRILGGRGATLVRAGLSFLCIDTAMKTSRILSLLLILPQFLHAQQPDWLVGWPVNWTMNPSMPRHVLASSPGGELMTARVDGVTQLYGSEVFGAAVVHRLDPGIGQPLWSCALGTTTTVNCGAVDDDGNVYVAGQFMEALALCDGSTLGHTGSGLDVDLFLIKFDPAGMPLWKRNISIAQPNATMMAALAIAAWRLRSARVLGRATLWLGGTLALTCGWWFVRNLVVKGDLLGWGKWVRSAGVVWRKVPFQTQLPDYFAIQWQSFWGSFGWVTVRMPDPVYRLLLVVTVLALLGLLGASARWWRAWRAGRAEARPAWAALVIGSAALLVYASVFQLAFTFDLTVAQGRYLFTALPAFLIAFTVGLVSLAPRSRAPQAATAVATSMLVLALYACFGVLRPTFRPPDELSAADLAALDPGLRLRFGRDIELLGAELPRGGIRAGEDLPVGLIWRTARWIDEGEVVFVHLVDRAGRMLARADFLPRQGLYPTVLWYPNWPWRDRLSLPVAADAPAGAADLLVGLYPDGEPQRGLPASVDGRILGDHATVGRVMVRALEPERVPAAAMARGDILGFTDRSGIWKDLLRLEAFQVFAATDPSSEEPGADGATAVDIVLYWRALDALPEDYTVFVHALAPDGSQLAGADGPPGQGRFPSSLWAAGDLMADRHQVILPREAREADIRWQVGLYLPATGARLPARNAQGQPWADGAILLQP